MAQSQALSTRNVESELSVSIVRWTQATVDQTLTRAVDITRDKTRAVTSFFEAVGKEVDRITSQDVLEWHQHLLDRGLSERYIYASLSHLYRYFEWLRRTELRVFLKINPVRSAMPKPPKKYNSPKAKSLTDEELGKLWNFIESKAQDESNLLAVRDYAIFRLFTATGMRREEVINLFM